MDKEKAIQILKRCEAESHCGHYKRHYCCIGCGQREALDLAIKALEREIEYGQMVVNFTKGDTMKSDEWKYDTTCDAESATTTDCISRQQATWIALMSYFMPQIYTHEDAIKALRKASDIINSTPPVTPTNNIQQTDTLIIAAALRYFAQDSDWDISDRERAKELRKQVLECGEFMCKPVTPTERTGEWIKNDDFTCSACGYHMIVGGGAYNFCPNCGAKMGGDTE